jgi:hypothetical protein
MKIKVQFLLCLFFVSLIGACNTKTRETPSAPAVSPRKTREWINFKGPPHDASLEDLILGKSGGRSVTSASGASLGIPHGTEWVTYGREWITFHDASLPADLVGTVGLRASSFQSKYTGNAQGGVGTIDFIYTAEYTVDPKEPLYAIDIRFLSFDVWGRHQRSFSATHIQDIEGGKQIPFSLSWKPYPENSVQEFYASIAYIARVRTKSGRIVEADSSPVVEEAKKFDKNFTVEDLEPKPEKK